MCTGEALDGANGFANEVLVLGVDPPVKMNGLFVTGANWLVLPNTADPGDPNIAMAVVMSCWAARQAALAFFSFFLAVSRCRSCSRSCFCLRRAAASAAAAAALSSSEKIEPVALFPLLTKESLHDPEQNLP